MKKLTKTYSSYSIKHSISPLDFNMNMGYAILSLYSNADPISILMHFSSEKKQNLCG